MPQDDRSDLVYKVAQTLGDFADQYDIGGIADFVTHYHGGDIDSIPEEEFKALLERYERTLPAYKHRNTE